LLKPVERIAAFQDRDHASAGVLTGDADDDLCQLSEVAVGEREASERITFTRIEASRNQHQLRLEPFGCRDKYLAEGAQDFAATRACREWPVDDQTVPLAVA